MTFDEFKITVAENIRDYLPEPYEKANIQINTRREQNDQELSALEIKFRDSSVTPSIYLEGYYDDLEAGVDMDVILNNIAETRAAYDIQGKQIADLDAVKDRIMPRLMNAEANKEYLKGKPHTDIEDLTVAYTVKVGNLPYGEGTVTITDEMLDAYGISIEELHDIAMENLDKSDIRAEKLSDVLKELTGMDMPDPEDSPTLYIVSNKTRTNGASALLSKQKLDEVAQKIGGNFVIIPSSVHEIIAMPAEGPYVKQTLDEMIQDINRTQLAPGEFLSDHAYMYDAKERKLVLDFEFDNPELKYANALRQEISPEPDRDPEINEMIEIADHVMAKYGERTALNIEIMPGKVSIVVGAEDFKEQLQTINEASEQITISNRADPMKRVVKVSMSPDSISTISDESGEVLYDKDDFTHDGGFGEQQRQILMRELFPGMDTGRAV